VNTDEHDVSVIAGCTLKQKTVYRYIADVHRGAT
jgi:hypothetical protein